MHTKEERPRLEQTNRTDMLWTTIMRLRNPIESEPLSKYSLPFLGQISVDGSGDSIRRCTYTASQNNLLQSNCSYEGSQYTIASGFSLDEDNSKDEMPSGISMITDTAKALY